MGKLLLSILCILLVHAVLRLLRAAPRTTAFSRLLADREVSVVGEIDDEAANRIVAQLLFLENENSSEPITLVVNSVGGSVTSALAIHDTIGSISTPVHTYCPGAATGMAVLLLACGEKGNRRVTGTTDVCLVPVQARPGADDGAIGPELTKTRLVVAELLANCTGQHREVLLQAMQDSRCFSPEEVVQMGITCDCSFITHWQ